MTFWEDLYRGIAPLTKEDEALGYPLRAFVQAVADPFEIVQTLVRDDAEGRVGWSILLDPTRAPDEVLPWLLQMVGAVPSPNETADSMRQRIKDAEAFKRGTPASIQEAASRAGAPNILLQERYGGSAYALRILFTAAEYSDEVFARVIEKVPAGIVVTHDIWDGVVYSDILAGNATYADLLVAYTDYADMRGV